MLETRASTSKENRNTAIWFALNLALASAFMFVASGFWVEPQLRGIPGAGIGNAFGWLFFAVPIFVASLIANVGVLVWAARRRRVTGVLPIRRLGWILVVLWIGLLMFDGSRHGA